MSMYPRDLFFTSESVTEGHPDKFCDQISDAILDECLKVDPNSRVACETLVTMGLIIVGNLKLRQPIYLKTAVYGHFGRPEFTWERLDATDELLAKAKRR